MISHDVKYAWTKFVRILLLMCIIQGVPKKKKDILNIHIKSEGINIFSQKFCWTESTIFVVKCKNSHLNPIIHYIALIQTLKRHYAVNGHEMYCILLLVRCTHIDTYSHKVTNSKRFYDKM